MLEAVMPIVWVAVGTFGILAIIAIHEAGHLLVARLLRIEVREFAVGMGPKLLAHTRGDTEYSLRLLPIGGFVLLGPDDPDLANTNDWEEFRDKLLSNKIPAWQRLPIFLGGSLANLAVAFLAFLFAGFFFGASSLAPTVGTVSGSAAAAGIQAGDTLTAIDGQPVEDWSQADGSVMSALAASRDVLTFTVERRGDDRHFQIVPPGDAASLYCLGLEIETVRHGLSESMAMAAGWVVFGVQFLDLVVEYISSVTLLEYADREYGLVGQTVAMYEVGQEIQQYEGEAEMLSYAVFIFALMNVVLGLFNLLPILPFDGGRIALSLTSALRGRTSPGLELGLIAIGASLMLLLAAMITFYDLRDLIR